MYLHSLFELPRFHKQLLLIGFDTLLISAAFFISGAYLFSNLSEVSSHVYLLAVLTPILLLVFAVCGFYQSMIRYLGAFEMLKIVAASLVAFGIHVVLIKGALQSQDIVPSAIFCMVLFMSVISSRLAVAELYGRIVNKSLSKVLIYGAGNSGIQLIHALQSSDKYRPVAIVDDEPSLQGMNLHGLKVFAPKMVDRIIREEKVEQILLAMPSISRARRREIIDNLMPYPVRVRTIPGLSDLVNGEAPIDQIKDIDVEDLLGRDQVEPIPSMMEACIKDKVVLITGAGGSIGSELSRQIARFAPSHVILFDSCEFALYQVEKDVTKIVESDSAKVKITSLLGSVLEKNRLTEILKTFHVNTVYHAAAYKHVPMVEHNIIPGVRNNVFGTWYCAEAAIEAKVGTFVLVSTDKAVRSTNVMGATKRLAELILQGLAQKVEVPNYCMVRFGNVLGSSGSVVPLFREQIAEGGPVTVTHPEIIRYFMTIPEAAQLVIQAGALARNGEVFVLDMGEPVKIADLAKKLVSLMGLEIKTEENPYGDIEIKYTGLRPGEKLYEELLIGDNPSGTDHPRIMCAEEITLPWENVHSLLLDLKKACDDYDCEKVRELLLSSESGYSPNEEMSDWVWSEKSKQNASVSNVVSVFSSSKTKIIPADN